MLSLPPPQLALHVPLPPPVLHRSVAVRAVRVTTTSSLWHRSARLWAAHAAVASRCGTLYACLWVGDLHIFCLRDIVVPGYFCVCVSVCVCVCKSDDRTPAPRTCLLLCLRISWITQRLTPVRRGSCLPIPARVSADICVFVSVTASIGDVVVGTVLPKGEGAALDFRAACMLAGLPHVR